MLRHTMIAAAILAASVVAQATCYQIPDNSMTGSNVIPFGSNSNFQTWGNQKYQMLVFSSDVKNTAGNVCELAFAPVGTGVRHFDTIRIRLGYFALSGTKLGTTFSANLKNPQTVLDAKNYDWPHTADKFNPIGLQNSFTYIPQLGHLVIEITVTGARFPNSSAGFREAFLNNPNGPRQRMFANGWTTEPTTGTWGSWSGLNVEICYQTAMANIYGQGCAGSNNTVPVLAFTGLPKTSSSFSLNVTGGLANANMFLVLGLNRLQTPVLLPGTKSCHAYLSLDVVLLQKMNGMGTFSQTFPVPKNVPDCLKVYLQAFPWDQKANSFGASATPYGRLRVGQ
jgi:hypothetical protein